MASFNATPDRYRDLLAAQQAGQLKLPNEDLDVGELTRARSYKPADRAYAQSLEKLEGTY